ncbi:MAG: hypothetical protein ABR526_05090 [Chthoniobacterales bacterium]
MTDTPPPLWQSVVGDTEPWRRGRLALVILAVLTALMQAFTLSRLVLTGAIEAVAIQASLAALFWLQFYFIWIGIQWVRWLQGAFSICFGFIMLIWGFVWGAGLLIPIGTFTLLGGSYVGFAPAVYFFAIRQRERRDWRIALAVGAVFLLLVASLGALIFGLSRYRLELESRAHDPGIGAVEFFAVLVFAGLRRSPANRRHVRAIDVHLHAVVLRPGIGIGISLDVLHCALLSVPSSIRN